jgi:hypothetical protein
LLMLRGVAKIYFRVGRIREGRCRRERREIPVDARCWHGGGSARAVANCRRSKIIRFPREARIAVCGLCGRFLSLDRRPQKSIILLFCLG